MTRRERATGLTIRDWKIAGITAAFAAGLLLSGALRFYNLRAENPPQLTAYATFIYIGVTILAAVLLTRAAVPMRRLGFGAAFKPARYLVLAAIGVAVLQLSGYFLEAFSERFLGQARDLGRFSDVAGSPSALIRLMALNWTIAAFGEELAFRIVLMRAIAYTLGDSRTAFGIALIAQALVFGLVHAYQGPAGVIGTCVNGLVFGGLTLAARGSIWPAAIAHGASNSIGIVRLFMSG